MPTAKLTKRMIDALTSPAVEDVEYRDTQTSGLMLRLRRGSTKKMLYVEYRTKLGRKTKKPLGAFGIVTLDQARSEAIKVLADVAKGGDPAAEDREARQGATVRDMIERFLRDYAAQRYKATTLKQATRILRTKAIPAIGTLKVTAVRHSDIANLHARLKDIGQGKGVEANHVVRYLSKVFSEAERWGWRDRGTNPCRGVQKYREKGTDRLLTDGEVRAIFATLDQVDADGSEHAGATLAIRLMFALCGRATEIGALQWPWVRRDRDVVIWPDPKGNSPMEKPLVAEARRLLDAAEKSRVVGVPYVCTTKTDPKKAMTVHTIGNAWERILKRAGVAHCGTHAIRHRAVTDVANDPSIPLAVGMKLSGHKTVSQFMRYVHTTNDQVREAAESVATRRAEMLAKKPGTVVQLRP